MLYPRDAGYDVRLGGIEVKVSEARGRSSPASTTEPAGPSSMTPALLADQFGRAWPSPRSRCGSSSGSSSPWRVIRRHDIGVLGKVLWIVIILVIPLLGLFVYFLWDAMRTKPA